MKKITPMKLITVKMRYQVQILWGLLNLNIVIRNGNIVWKHRPYCWYFRLNLKYHRTENTSKLKNKTKQKKNQKGDFCKGLLREYDFDTVLATHYCYNYGANASEAVRYKSLQIKKIITNVPPVL